MNSYCGSFCQELVDLLFMMKGNLRGLRARACCYCFGGGGAGAGSGSGCSDGGVGDVVMAWGSDSGCGERDTGWTAAYCGFSRNSDTACVGWRGGDAQLAERSEWKAEDCL